MDWGGEFHSLRDIFKKYDILHRATCPYSHQQNGSVERCHRHIVETGIFLLSHASIPQKYWANAFQTAVFLIDCMPTLVLNHKSPYEILMGQSPDYHFLCVFGSSCLPNLRPLNHNKLDIRSKYFVLMGYSLDHKG